MNLRSVFVSDFHLGSYKAEPEALTSFIEQLKCESLYLVGDIIDGWKLEQRWHWPESYTLLISALIRLRDRGTKIIYVTGNHDEKIRILGPVIYALFKRQHGVDITHRITHTTADGRKFVVMHGDQFDRAIMKGGISRLSDKFVNWIAERIGFWRHETIMIGGRREKFSLSKLLRHSGYKAIKTLNSFEQSLEKFFKSNDVDGLICGHTHIPDIRFINGKLYGNCGYWMAGSNTYIAEDETGHVSLHEWHHQESLNLSEQKPLPCAEAKLLSKLAKVIWNPSKMLFDDP